MISLSGACSQQAPALNTRSQKTTVEAGYTQNFVAL